MIRRVFRHRFAQCRQVAIPGALHNLQTTEIGVYPYSQWAPGDDKHPLGGYLTTVEERTYDVIVHFVVPQSGVVELHACYPWPSCAPLSP